MDNRAVREWLTRPGGLSAQLKAARLAAGLTGQQLGDALGWGQAKVSKMENGRQMPTAEQVGEWAGACGLKRAEARGLAALADEGRTVHLRWRQRITSQAEHQGDYNRMVAEASAMFHFETTVLPGILQTIEYATAVLTVWDDQLGRDRDPEDIVRSARLRLQRAEYLYDPAKSFRFVFAQDLLTSWRYLDGPGMAAQLDRLVMLAHLPAVDLRVIPNRGRQPLGVAVCEPFTLYDGLVVGESWHGEPMSEDPDKLADYRRAAEVLTAASLDPAGSLELIRQAAEAERAGLG